MSDSVGRFALLQSFFISRKYRVFAHALNTVKRIPRTGSARPPSSDRLKLYGLYKQSMEGNVEGVMRRPPDNVPDTEGTKAEREKWDAWRAQSGLSRTAAKRAYISTLITTMHQYASSTPEAKELIAELEFVWDQIKAISNSTSHESSPEGGMTGEEERLGVSYASLAHSRGSKTRDDEGGGDRLKVLRPVSDRDQEEEYDEDGFDEKDQRVSEEPYSETDPARTRDLDLCNRKWRKRIESALIRTSTEVAALREQIETKGIGRSRLYRKGIGEWAWVRWLLWAAMRQLLFDAVILALAYVWAKRKGDQRIEQGLWLVMQTVKEHLRELSLRGWRLRGLR
ncbi:MAG: hypothetical protein Q9207_000791 [Kuettlingeria erythrocarpa]